MAYTYSPKKFNYEQPAPKNKFWKFFKIAFFAFLVLVVLISSFSYKVIFSQDSALSGLGRLPVIKQFRQIFGMEKLQGELDDRINVLLLGQGGVGHDGPYLTDTIILGSFKPSDGSVAMISIPRDFYVEIENNGWAKINTANSIGEVNDYEGGGSAYAAKIVGDTFDIPIHYWARIDFFGFLQMIDKIGGVNVCVEQSFFDPLYPTDDYETQDISFEAGCQNMDGDTALKFARSRHGNNGEGSDFARAARQQKIILALKDKILDIGTLASPSKIYNLISFLDNHIQTNIDLAEIPHFLKITEGASLDNITSIVLDNSQRGLLRDSITADGMYVLVPRTGNLNEIKILIENIFVLNSQSLPPINLVVLNGTEIEGWANETTGYLESLGFDILASDNSPQQTYEKTVIYDLEEFRQRNNDKDTKDGLKILKKSLDANVTKFVPEFLQDMVAEYDSADYFVVLGCTEDDIKCQTKENLSEQVQTEIKPTSTLPDVN